MTRRPDHAESAALERAVLRSVRDLAAELHPQSPTIPTLTAQASLEADFGLDSLARVELVTRLERATGARLPEQAFAEADTPAAIARWLARAGGAAAPDAAGATVRTADILSGELPGPAAAELPREIGTLVAALDWHAGRHPARVHLLLYGEQDEPRPVTYGRLHAMSHSAAVVLAASGAAAGDRVAIMLPTGEAFFVAFHGALRARAVPVPLYPPARPSQLEDHLRRVAAIIANAGAVVLVVPREARRVAALLRPLAPSLRRVIDAESLLPATGEPPMGAMSVPQATGRACAPGDVAFLQYTSGSTGQPKGVVLTHANLLANLRAMRDATGATSADVFVSWLPLSHDMGLIGASLGAMAVGFPLALMSPLGFLSRPARWLWLVHRHRATLTAAPNFAFELCADKVRDDEIRGLDLSSLRFLFDGAEAVGAGTLERFRSRFADHGLAPGALAPVYGLAECALGLTFPPPGRGPRVDLIDRGALREGEARAARAGTVAPMRVVSCGRVLAGHEIRIVGPDGANLGERRQGEIEFRGPSATSGYHGDPAATARLRDGDWLRTGDLGYVAAGELYVTGRLKDIIIRGGHNIHPQELEDAAMRVPGVRKGGVAVFPARDPVHGTERIVILAETSATRAEERARIEAGIARLAVDLIGLPADEIVLAPPHAVLKTSSGKVRRAACRERYERGEAALPVRPPWQQVLRLGAAGAAAAVRAAGRRTLALAWGGRACGAFLLLAPLAFAAIVVTPGLTARRRVARAGARALFRAWGTPPRVQGDAAGLSVAASSATRGCLVVSNHASYLDSLVLTAALPAGIVFVAKRALAPQRVAGLLLRRLGAMFVDRIDPRRGASDAAQVDAALARGDRVVVFPEGTFVREPGLLPLRMGAFLSAAVNAAPVIPVAILGTRAMLPDDDLLPRRAELRVVVGAPMLADGRDWRAAVDLRARVRSWLLAQTGEPDREDATSFAPAATP